MGAKIRVKRMKKDLEIKVLDKGFVRYVDHLGTDQRIVEAARISYKSPSKGEEQDKKLLHYLYKHRHSSPFEQCNITFNIKMPIFVMRQFVRHRTFRLNEWSARYSEMEPDFYIPKEWRSQDVKNKQGSVCNSGWNPIIGIETEGGGLLGEYDRPINASEKLTRTCGECFSLYLRLIKEGVAKEMARMVLPVNLYTEIYVNCDLHNLMHFLKLRMDSHAQWEIQQFAKAMYEIAKELYPWTIEAFDKYKWEIKSENKHTRI